MTGTAPLPTLTSSTEEHCRRVEAFAQELGRAMQLSRQSAEVLMEASRHHHDAAFRLASTARLSNWLFEGGKHSDAPLSNEVVRVLRIANGIDLGFADNDAGELAYIMTAANSFDEMLEFRRFEPCPVNKLRGEMRAALGTAGPMSAVHDALSRVCRDRSGLALQAAQALPVSAVRSLRQLAQTPADNVTAELLLSLAEKDPVLTADVLRVANSAMNGPQTRISSLSRAIAHLGTLIARQVLLASLLRRLVASGRLRSVWQHSLKVADQAKFIATMSGFDPEAAFTAGLLHDVGRIAFLMVGGDGEAIYTRLLDAGVPVLWAEWVAFQHDHAELGKTLLSQWNFPSNLVESVEHHHEPELSPSILASILYLAELRSGEREASAWPDRTAFAWKRTGILPEDLEGVNPDLGISLSLAS